MRLCQVTRMNFRRLLCVFVSFLFMVTACYVFMTWVVRGETTMNTGVMLIAAVGFVVACTLNFMLLCFDGQKARSYGKNRDKSSFLVRVSHEILTPMNSILGMADLIMRKNVSREVLEYVFSIQQSCANLLGITNDILNFFSKIETGQFKITSRNYHVASMINDVINLVRTRLIGKTVKFFVKVDSGIPEFLVGDEAHVQQILINLLNYAVKYTQSGYIILTIEQEMMGEKQVRLSIKVEDSGSGIKEKNMDELFVDFTCMESIQSSRVDKTRLGLSIARILCRAMDGDVLVDSEYGHGSTFTATVLQSSGSDKKIAAVNDAEGKNVLVFEERPLYVDSVTHALTGLGVRATYVVNMDDFNRELKDKKYDHILVSSAHVIDCMFAVDRINYPLLVNMVDLWEGPVFKGVASITMPLFCANVAKVLNFVTLDKTMQEMDENPDQYTTPFEVAGVSVEDGLRNSGGSFTNYISILADFCKDAEERAAQLEKCATDGNVFLYITLVHALKGASRSIGALAFADLAERMENAAKKEYSFNIVEGTGYMLTVLRDLISSIKDMLNRYEQAEDRRMLDVEDLPELKLDILKSALVNMDVRTVNGLMMKYATFRLTGRTRKIISEIEQDVLLFEYDKALEKIDILLGGKNS